MGHLWGHLLAGGAGVEWLFGYGFPHHDINLEDFRSRDQMWRQTTHALEFFRRYLPFAEMTSADELVKPSGTFCFAQPGQVYTVQWRGGEADLQLWLPDAKYTIQWFDPRPGGDLRSGSVAAVRGGSFVSLGKPPRNPDRDWIILIKLDGPAPSQITAPPAG
jgi:hypothetical protein